MGMVLSLLSLGLLCFSAVASIHPKEQIAYVAAQAKQAVVEQDLMPHGTVHVNIESVEGLQKMPGIGPVLAQQIVLEREENGLFYFPEDLLVVKGIGQGKLEKIRDLLVFDHPLDASER